MASNQNGTPGARVAASVLPSILSPLCALVDVTNVLHRAGIDVTYATASVSTPVIIVARTDLSAAISTLNADAMVPAVDVTDTYLCATVSTAYGPLRVLSSL